MKPYGYFENEKREYIIENMYPKRPWLNFMWNERLIAFMNQFGIGGSWYRDENGTRVNLCREADSRIVFIRDEETHEFWAANRNYLNEKFDDFHTVVGQGYSEIVSEYRGIRVTYRIFIPVEGCMECWSVSVENTGSRQRQISLFSYANVDCNLTWHLAYNHGTFSKELNGVILSHHGFDLPTDLTEVYFACDQQVSAYETTDRRFTGVYGGIQQPEAIVNGDLSCEDISFDGQMIAALQFKLDMQPGEKKHFNFLLGRSQSEEAAVRTCRASLSENVFKRELEKLRQECEEIIKKVQIQSPDMDINTMANIWLKRQMTLGKTWGRVYAKGFRDLMQDVTGFMPLDSKKAAEKIKNCLEYQFENGNTLRQWQPDDFHPYHDGAGWLVPAVVSYLKETGDFGFLDEEVCYYGKKEKGTVLDHCRRGLNFLFSNLGEHGLCLWGGGDWNDSINNAGLKLKGESVWLSEAAVKSARDFIELLEKLGRNLEALSLGEKLEELSKNIAAHGWDGDHFIYGINDWGEKIGAYESIEGQVYLNPQTWAVLSCIVEREQASQLMDYIEKELSCSYGYVQQKPSYTKGSDHIGRISYMEKGSYENGSVYNHGVAFKIAADCKLGRGNLAYESIKKMLTIEKGSPAIESGVEPYVIINIVYCVPVFPFNADILPV